MTEIALFLLFGPSISATLEGTEIVSESKEKEKDETWIISHYSF